MTTSSDPVGRQLSSQFLAPSSFGAMARTELSRMLRFPAEFAASYAQLFLISLTWSLTGLLFTPDGAALEMRSDANGLVVYGFIWIIYLTDTLWSIGYYLRPGRAERSPRQRFISPAVRFADLTSKVTITLFWTGLLSFGSAALMNGVFGEFPFENGLLGLFILVMTLSGTFGSGLAAVALTQQLKEAVQTALYVMLFALVLLCAPFVPFAALPAPLQTVARLIPLSYGLDAFRSTLTGYANGVPELAPIEVELIIVILFGMTMPFLGYWLFQRAENNAGMR